MPKKFFTTSEKRHGQRLTGKSSNVEHEASKVKTESDVFSLDSSMDMDFQDDFDDLLQKSGSNMAKTLLAKQKKTDGIAKKIPRRSEQGHGKGRGKSSDDAKMQLDKEKAMENILSDTIDTSSEMDSQSQIDNILQEFGDNVTKSLVSKQKKVGMEIQETSDVSLKEMINIFKVSQAEQQQYLDEYREKFAKFFEDANANLKADKEKRTQLEEQMKQQEQQLNESRMQCTQELEALQKTTNTFFKNFEELNQNYEGRFNDVQNNLAKSLKQMEKKVQMENQALTMSKLRKNLQSFFE